MRARTSTIIIISGLLLYSNTLLACLPPSRPTSILYGSPATVRVGQTIYLDGSHSIPGSGYITRYYYSFDYVFGLTTCTWELRGSTTTYSYSDPGQYTVGLNVVNSYGLCSYTTESGMFTVNVTGPIYVDKNATGKNDGSSWEDAFNELQDALTEANNIGNIHIWVAAGIYKPHQSDRWATFQLKNGVEIYGGFNGTETSRDQRDWLNNKTILSGDLEYDDTTGIRNDNAYHVITAMIDTNATAVLDGFTILGGNANGSVGSNSMGGGLFINYGNPTITNCVFSDNWSYYGAGVYNNGGSPTFTNCLFSKNEVTFSSGYGGGVYNCEGSAIFTNCVFIENNAYDGGGAYNDDGTDTYYNCTFSQNKAVVGTWHGDGGGVYNNSGEPNYINCTFSRNEASDGGGTYNNGGEPNFTNCAFSKNDAGSGAGVYNNDSDPNFTGCLFTESINGNAIYNNGGSEPNIKDCAFIKNNDGYLGAIYNNWHGTSYSPQIINCVFADNGNPYMNGGAISCYQNCYAKVTNCVFNNNSASQGGAIYNDTDGQLDFNNCIFWGNNATNGGGEIYNWYGTIRLGYCDIEGGWSGGKVSSTGGTITDGGGNIKADPNFCDVNNPSGEDGVFFTEDDGLQIIPSSACVDTCPTNASPDKDILSKARVNIPFIGSETDIVDMGAYEVAKPIWHVKAPGTSQHGLTWEDTFEYLQDALAQAKIYGGEIWVATGTYKPDIGGGKSQGDSDANFALINGIGIYGGFAGNETLRAQRNVASNETILSGNIDDYGNADSYHVITAIEVNQTAILDGFTISDGNAISPYYYGGGMYNYIANPTVLNCNFKNNFAQFGGGISNSLSNPVIFRCSFNNNEATASSYGGAVYNVASSPEITDCNFTNNKARYGGGLANLHLSTPKVTNCVFSQNHTPSFGTGNGGAIYDYNNGSPIITNCVFVENSAKSGGGIYNYFHSNTTITSCTFTQNLTIGTSGDRGSFSNISHSSCVATNCIFWKDDTNEIFNGSDCNMKLSYCDIEGGLYREGGLYGSKIKNFTGGVITDGGGNINNDPCFLDQNNPVGPDGVWFTADDGLQLTLDNNINDNLCVDSADGNAAPYTDICGKNRIDIEFLTNIGVGNPDYADIGAYEYYNPIGYTTSFELNQGYGDKDSTIDGVDGWKVEDGSSDIQHAIDPCDVSHEYQYVEVQENTKINYDTDGFCEKSTVRINCIPSPGSSINIMDGPALIASIKFGEDTPYNMYVFNNGGYATVSRDPNYYNVAEKCRDYLRRVDTNPPYSYENTWIEFVIQFNWGNHTYDVNWTNWAYSDKPIYTGARFNDSHHGYTKIEFQTGPDPYYYPKFFALNRLTLTDTASVGGVIGSDEDIWIIAPVADVCTPVKGHCAIGGYVNYSTLGEYIVKCCPTDLNPNDPNSWMQVCSGRSISNYPITLGFWNAAGYYNGDYFLKIEIYDDLGRLHDVNTITTVREFNGRYKTCESRYPLLGKFKPQTFTYEEYPDFKINWPGTFPFEFKRMYNNSLRNRLYPLFFGWTHNHNIHLIEDCSFDWITDENKRPVRDRGGLAVGRLWLNSPSGGGLFIGHIDAADTNRVIYEPEDNENHYIIRTSDVNDSNHNKPKFDVNYVYYGPDGMKLMFNKEFEVGYQIPDNEGLVDWMVYIGIDKQEDRFGNSLIYTWDESEICLQEIGNNRTPAKLVLIYGGMYNMGYNPYLCSEIRLDNGNLSTGNNITFSGSISQSSATYGVNKERPDIDPPYRELASCTYSNIGQQYMLTRIIMSDCRGGLPSIPAIEVEYNSEGVLIKHKEGLYDDHGYGNPASYNPTKKYSYEYDNARNLTTTIELKSADESSLTLLRKDSIITSPDGALLSKNTRTYSVLKGGVEFKPYDYHYDYQGWWYGYTYEYTLNDIPQFGFHSGGGGATDTDYYYQDSRFPFKPTTIIEHFDDDGDGSYDRPDKKTIVDYNDRGTVNWQKVYIDDVNYVLTEYTYHPVYDFPIRQTTWQGYCATGAKVEKRLYYGNEGGSLIADGNYLVRESTLLDDVNNVWADTNYTYYHYGQIKQKIDPEGCINYYEIDDYNFICKEWQGAAFEPNGAIAGNPQKRYYYDGLGHKVLEGDYLGKVQMDIWDSYERLRQSREYIDGNAMSREDFVPESYDADISYDNLYLGDPIPLRDWWENRTIYNYYNWYVDRPEDTTLPTGGMVKYSYLHSGNNIYEWNYNVASLGFGVNEYVVFGLATEDGRHIGDSTYNVNTFESEDIYYVYDSMLRLRHKYSGYDDPQHDLSDYVWVHKYIKHEEYQYDASGNKTAETVYKVERQENGSFTPTLEKSNSYQYDILGRMTKQIIDNRPSGLNQITQFGYDAAGNRIWVIDPNGNILYTDYDNANRKIREYFTAENAETAKVKKEVSYYKNDKIKDVNSYDYNDALLSRSQYTYDSRGRIETVTEDINDTEQAVTSYDYNDSGFNDISDPCGYKYQIKITDANDKQTLISMYPLGQPQKIVYPSGDYEECVYYHQSLSEIDYYGYRNCNGLLEYKAVWDSAHNKKYIHYEYDDYGKVKQITYPDSGHLDYEYTLRTMEGFGKVKTITDHRNTDDRPGDDGSTYTFEYYNLTGQIKSYTDYNSYTVNYDYSAAYGQPTHIDVNTLNGTRIYDVNYVYDLAGRLVDVCEPMIGESANLIAGFEYDKNGNRKKLHYYREGTRNGNKTSIAYSYNKDNLLTGFSTTGGPVFTLNNVVVDGLGRLRDCNETITKADQTHIQHSYTNQYDMRSQLTYANMTNVGGLDWVRDTYSYDRAGNVQSHSYDTSADPVVETPFSFDGDLMIEAGAVSVDWDENGNLIGKDDTANTVIEYNWDNKLRSATKGTENISVKYDPMGNRVYKSSSVNGNRKYIVDVASGLPTILLEIDTSDSSLKKSYVYASGEILCQHDIPDDNKRYFYLHDRLGSVRQVIGTDGLVKNYYTFEPFGKTLESGGTLSNPFMFTGQYYDFEIGQYYLRARQYDLQLMRFTGRDPVNGDYEEPMTLHKYLYCFNNPINRIDPSGEGPIDALIAATEVYDAGLNVAVTGAERGDLDLIVAGAYIQELSSAVYNIELRLSGVCFPSGTEILTACGEMPIEKIQPGWYVWSADPQTGETNLFKVTKCFKRETDMLVMISVGNEKIEATPEHLFYVYGKGWCEAGNLTDNTKLIDVNNAPVAVNKIEFVNGQIAVYNLEIERAHAYYVSDAKILVHNGCGKSPEFKGTDAQRRLSKMIDDIVKRLKLSKDQRRVLHDVITGKRYGYWEIFQIAKDLFK